MTTSQSHFFVLIPDFVSDPAAFLQALPEDFARSPVGSQGRDPLQADLKRLRELFGRRRNKIPHAAGTDVLPKKPRCRPLLAFLLDL